MKFDACVTNAFLLDPVRFAHLEIEPRRERTILSSESICSRHMRARIAIAGVLSNYYYHDYIF